LTLMRGFASQRDIKAPRRRRKKRRYLKTVNQRFLEGGAELTARDEPAEKKRCGTMERHGVLVGREEPEFGGVHLGRVGKAFSVKRA